MDTSPAQRFMSRRTKTVLPTKEALLCPEVPNPEEQQHKLQKKQETQARYYNRSAKDLPKLTTGDVVRMKPTKTSTKIWKKATVVRKMDNRSYIVETPEGTTYRRNRYHIRKTAEQPPTSEPIEEIEVTTQEDEEQSEPVAEATSSSSIPSDPVVPATSALPMQSQSPNSTRPQRQRKPPAYLEYYSSGQT